jgi:excisionase family DNA binding protein
MGEIITRENERIVRFFKAIDNMSEGLEKLVVNRKPQFSGERFLTDKEVSAKLKVSRRTLQDWRTNGQIAYISLGGKTLYRESDIQAMLERNHRKAIE